MRIIGIAAIVTLVLTGCVGMPRDMSEGAPDAATVHSVRTRNTGSGTETYALWSVDGNSSGFGNWIYGYPTVHKLKPGPHDLTIYGRFSTTAAFGDTYVASIPLHAELKAGATYAIRGTVNGNNIDVWIDESGSGQRVTAVATAPYSQPDMEALRDNIRDSYMRSWESMSTGRRGRH